MNHVDAKVLQYAQSHAPAKPSGGASARIVLTTSSGTSATIDSDSIHANTTCARAR